MCSTQINNINTARVGAEQIKMNAGGKLKNVPNKNNRTSLNIWNRGYNEDETEKQVEISYEQRNLASVTLSPIRV